MKKIGICTLHNAINYGAVLQALSLQTVLENMGYQVEFLNLKSKMLNIAENEFKQAIQKSSKLLKVAKEFYSPEKDNYDTIIVRK